MKVLVLGLVVLLLALGPPAAAPNQPDAKTAQARFRSTEANGTVTTVTVDLTERAGIANIAMTIDRNGASCVDQGASCAHIPVSGHAFGEGSASGIVFDRQTGSARAHTTIEFRNDVTGVSSSLDIDLIWEATGGFSAPDWCSRRLVRPARAFGRVARGKEIFVGIGQRATSAELLAWKHPDRAPVLCDDGYQNGHPR